MNLHAKLMSDPYCGQIRPQLVRTDCPQMGDFHIGPPSQYAGVLIDQGSRTLNSAAQRIATNLHPKHSAGQEYLQMKI